MITRHNIIACHIQANLQTGLFGQFDGTKNHIVFLYQIAFYKQVSISFEHLQRQIFRFQCRRRPRYVPKVRSPSGDIKVEATPKAGYRKVTN